MSGIFSGTDQCWPRCTGTINLDALVLSEIAQRLDTCPGHSATPSVRSKRGRLQLRQRAAYLVAKANPKPAQ